LADYGFELEPSPKDLNIEDKMIWLIPLREGVQWHPPLNREFFFVDVKYTIRHPLDPSDYDTTRKQHVEAIDEGAF